MNREDWNKFVEVFNLDVDVTVRKEVTKADVILSLLDEGEIAFKGNKGRQFLIKINENFDFKILKTLVWDEIREFKQKLKEKS